MNNTFYSNNLLNLNNFVSKYSTIQSLVENLYLKAFIEAYGWIKKYESVNGLLENDIRNKFTHHFKHHNSFLKEYINNLTIIITKENEIYTKDETQRTDIELISSGHCNKFVVECKRLTYAETRYVKGTVKNGIYEIDGMEKFIKLIYAEKDDYAGMIGFVIKGNPKKIINSLKEKVRVLSPAQEITFLLTQIYDGWQLSFQSKHLRKDNTELHLYHLFFDFVK